MRAHVHQSHSTNRPVAVPLLGAERARELERRAQAQLGIGAVHFREQIFTGTLDQDDFVVAGLINLLPDEDILALTHGSIITEPTMIEWETIAYDGFPFVMGPTIGLTEDHARAAFERACQDQLGMSAAEFSRRYRAGELDPCDWQIAPLAVGLPTFFPVTTNE